MGPILSRPQCVNHDDMETFSALLALCAVTVTVEFPAQRPVTRDFGVFFDLRLNPTVEQTMEMPVIRDAIALIMMSL